MWKVRDRSTSLLRAGVTSVASPIGKLGQRTLDAGQTEVKQLWGLIERAFYPKGEGADNEIEGGEGAEDDGEEQSWEEVPQGMEEVNIFLDNLGQEDGVCADTSDLSSSGSSSLSSSAGSPRARRKATNTTAPPVMTPPRHPAGGESDGNSFVVKIKKGKDMAHKIMFYGVEKMTHLGRGGNKKKKDEEPEGLIEVLPLPSFRVSLCVQPRPCTPFLTEHVYHPTWLYAWRRMASPGQWWAFVASGEPSLR